jgi:hypothetical protein
MLSYSFDLASQPVNNNLLNLPVTGVSRWLSNLISASPKVRHPLIQPKGQRLGGMWQGETLASTLVNHHN